MILVDIGSDAHYLQQEVNFFLQITKNTHSARYVLYDFIGHPARIGNYVNMKYDPAWQNCSDDTQVSVFYSN